MDKTIVVMAAGLGSRYGGVKQIERLGPDGEILMEYAIYDAIRAGFNRIVLIIKHEIYNDVREMFGNRIEESTGIKIDYAFQTLDRFTESRPEFKARTKPFGTVHAVICAADCIKTPFAVMNADDYYGPGAFTLMYEALEKLPETGRGCMVAYKLRNTVSDFGTVTRGVCRIDGGEMTAVKETFKIGKAPDGSIRSFADSEEGVALDGESPVSMNFWGFTPWALDEMETYFHTFLRSEAGRELKSECLLPTMVGDMLREGSMHVDAYTTEEAWFGMTYHEDRATTAAMLRKLTAEGMYPETLY